VTRSPETTPGTQRSQAAPGIPSPGTGAAPVAVTAPRARRPRWVPLLMAGGGVSLLAGLWAGLLLLGVPLPAGERLADGHGVFMTLGFLGTLIALERAVALGAAWAYLAPAAAGAGGLALVAGAPAGLGQALLAAGGAVLVGIYAAVHRIQPSLHNTVQAVGAGCWTVTAGLWLAGWQIPRIVPWLAGFLVLTIAGERLELSRMTGATPRSRQLFVGVVGLLTAGLLASLVAEAVGVRVAGAGLLGLAAWLSTYDLARRTVRARGVTRYMAVALLGGYAWLAVAGALWLADGAMTSAATYGAMLHALFLGFVITMVFAHAPVIIPAVLGVRLPYHPVMYGPLALLHASLVLRLLGGDAVGSPIAWQWGGVLNEVAILLYVAVAVVRVVGAGTPRRAPV
jgi:hypothetical protein